MSTSPVVTSPQSQPGPVHSGYQEIDWIKTADGILCVISRRVSGRHVVPSVYSTAIFKVFERDGEECKTSFFDVVRQHDAVVFVVGEAKKRVEKFMAEDAKNGRRR